MNKKTSMAERIRMAESGFQIDRRNNFFDAPAYMLLENYNKEERQSYAEMLEKYDLFPKPEMIMLAEQRPNNRIYGCAEMERQYFKELYDDYYSIDILKLFMELYAEGGWGPSSEQDCQKALLVKRELQDLCGVKDEELSVENVFNGFIEKEFADHDCDKMCGLIDLMAPTEKRTCESNSDEDEVLLRKRLRRSQPKSMENKRFYRPHLRGDLKISELFYGILNKAIIGEYGYLIPAKQQDDSTFYWEEVILDPIVPLKQTMRLMQNCF